MKMLGGQYRPLTYMYVILSNKNIKDLVMRW